MKILLILVRGLALGALGIFANNDVNVPFWIFLIAGIIASFLLSLTFKKKVKTNIQQD